VSAGRRPARTALFGATLALTLVCLAVAVAPRDLRADAPPRAAESRFAEPRISPSCTPAQLDASAVLAGSRVTVSPAPGSRDASASTQVSLVGVPAAELSHVTASGSLSGAHAGRLQAYSQGDGASFVPSQAFTQGEVVHVAAQLSEGAQTIPFAWSFTIAVQDHGGVAGGSPRPSPRASSYQRFLSRPDLQPPTVSVTAHSAQSAPGDLFVAPYSGPGQYGPMILDDSGALVYFKSLSPPGTRAADFRVQRLQGRPVLTWWQDPLIAGGSRKAGEVVLDSSYRQVAIVRAGNGYQPDLHEFQITPQGVGLITVYDGIDCDLSSVGGPRTAAVADTLMQEIDLKTGLVRFEWHSLDHVALGDSYASAAHASRTTPFDYFHINSIDVRRSGDLLVDARNTWAAYDVDARTGQVHWRLGGRHSSFAMGAGAGFAWQHDAREQPDGTITLFDNGATPAIHRQSRAIALRLGGRPQAATLVREQAHPQTPLVAGSQGNVQALPGGAWMVGWGESPYFSEFAPDGQLAFDAHLPPSYESYRAYRLPWSARPAQPPALAVRRAAGGHGASVYASWNGATEVAAWRVLAGRSPGALAPLAGAARSGFETKIALASLPSKSYLQAQALDAAGAVIGASRVQRV
jgi:hypothetical protein